MSEKLRRTVIKVAIHREQGNPIFDEGVTTVTLDDEAGGFFVVVKQNEPHKDGELRFNPGELEVVAEVAAQLIADAERKAE